MPNIKSTGCFGMKPLVVFTSIDSHYSMRKSCHWLGIGVDNLVSVRTDEFGCMSIDDLIVCIERVRSENRQPFFVNATAGTTVLGAFDNLNAIADICKRYDLWMHVDVSVFDRFRFIFRRQVKKENPFQCFVIIDNASAFTSHSRPCSSTIRTYQPDKLAHVHYCL